MPSPAYVVSDRRGTRYLEFSHDRSFSLSSMPLDDPGGLVAPYMREMMRGLVLAGPPQHVLLLGVGGGSQAKWLLRHLPRTRVTGVELDPEVLALAHAQFHLPPPGERLALVVADAVRHVHEAPAACADAVLVDICAPRMPPAAVTPGFYAAVRRCLRAGGVFCANHYAETADDLRAQRAAMASAFAWVHATRVAPDNTVFFGGADPLPPAAVLARRAAAIEPAWRLGLREFVAALTP